MRWSVLLWLACACGRANFDLIGDVGETIRDVDSPDADDCAVSGLSAAWSMNLADVSGATLHDNSGNGRDGTFIGSPAPVVANGYVGGALDFAATSLAYVDVPTLPLVATPGAVSTVSLWFRNDNANVDEGVFCMPAGPIAAPPRYCMWLTTSNGPPSLCINGGEGECWGIQDAGLIGRWVHVAALYVNGATTGGSFFIDGVAATMSCVFGTCDKSRVVQGPFEIGNSDATYPWHGLLDDVRVYARALDASDVATVIRCAR